MEEKKNLFDKYAILVEQNIRGVQVGVYSVALVGLCVALRSVRPFLKFCSPRDIPDHFIKKKMSFYGKVLRVEPPDSNLKSPVILIDHNPIFSLFTKKNSGLPVEVSSIDVSSNGLSWMHSILVNSQVKFTPLRKSNTTAHCILQVKDQNVGVHLVSIGFASVSGLDFDLEKDPVYLKYYKNLLAAEAKAERKGAGMWANEQKSWMSHLLSKSRISKLSLI